MQFIADESCDFAVVRELRAAGHDVIAVAELDAGIEDDVVTARALGERRVLLTEDKDFGQIVFASRRRVSFSFDSQPGHAPVWRRPFAHLCRKMNQRSRTAFRLSNPDARASRGYRPPSAHG